MQPMLAGVMGAGMDRRQLKVPMVNKVDVIGKQAKRVDVEFSHERLAALGITPLAIAESLKSPTAARLPFRPETMEGKISRRLQL
jgi:multidrug efflux pump subunit AcrB